MENTGNDANDPDEQGVFRKDSDVSDGRARLERGC
jgi:hypothetical protein